jgi:carnitine O-acetyltransferase
MSFISCVSYTDFTFFLDGFFDAGMLLSALKAKEDTQPTVERDVVRRNIGRRLTLQEY